MGLLLLLMVMVVLSGCCFEWSAWVEGGGVIWADWQTGLAIRDGMICSE